MLNKCSSHCFAKNGTFIIRKLFCAVLLNIKYLVLWRDYYLKINVPKKCDEFYIYETFFWKKDNKMSDILKCLVGQKADKSYLVCDQSHHCVQTRFCFQGLKQRRLHPPYKYGSSCCFLCFESWKPVYPYM